MMFLVDLVHDSLRAVCLRSECTKSTRNVVHALTEIDLLSYH